MDAHKTVMAGATKDAMVEAMAGFLPPKQQPQGIIMNTKTFTLFFTTKNRLTFFFVVESAPNIFLCGMYRPKWTVSTRKFCV